MTHVSNSKPLHSQVDAQETPNSLCHHNFIDKLCFKQLGVN